MDEQIRLLNRILEAQGKENKAFEDLRREVNEISNDLTAMKTKLDVVLDQKKQVEDLVLTVNTLKTQFRIVWGVFAFGFVSVGGLVVTAIFSGLVL